MTIEVVAWCDKETGIYTMQAKAKGKSEINKLTKEAKDWSHSGAGYDPNSGKTIILLKKKFESKSSWLKFAKTLSFEVCELARNGKKKVINGRRK
jgi:hypothetical protein|tara:strand:+ start:327 stop:611 length:285 start_codon:yes stop_codon:yes gene_type:complete